MSVAAPTAPKPKGPPGCLARLFRYFLLLVAFGAIVVVIDGLKVTLPIGTPGSPAKGEMIGVLHIHTKVSDGGGEISDVVENARWADLSFVAITDHNLALAPEHAGKDVQNVLLVGGEEVSTPDGHFLALGVERGWRDGVPKETRALLEAARKAGGTRVLAHIKGTRKDWTDWETNDFDAIEIWNGDAAWRDNNPLQLLMSALLYTVNPDLAMVRLSRRPEATLAQWDKLLETRKVAGICGADAHSRIPVFGWGIDAPGYLRVFKLARQHVLLDAPSGTAQPPRDAEAVVRAIRNGRSYCAMDGLAVASGFVNRAEADGIVAGPGQSVPWVPGATLRVSVPQGSGRPRIKVYKDGIEWEDKRGWRLDADLDSGPGVYRTEVWLRQPGLTGGQRWTPWILSNPIYVTGGAAPLTEPTPTVTPVPRAGGADPTATDAKRP